jgi:hypothetical protein
VHLFALVKTRLHPNPKIDYSAGGRTGVAAGCIRGNPKKYAQLQRRWLFYRMGKKHSSQQSPHVSAFALAPQPNVVWG